MFSFEENECQYSWVFSLGQCVTGASMASLHCLQHSLSSSRNLDQYSRHIPSRGDADMMGCHRITVLLRSHV